MQRRGPSGTWQRTNELGSHHFSGACHHDALSLTDGSSRVKRECERSHGRHELQGSERVRTVGVGLESSTAR